MFTWSLGPTLASEWGGGFIYPFGNVGVNELYSIGNRLQDTGDYERAATVWDRALRVAPRDPGIWHNRGVALSRLGRQKEALYSYDRALAIRPGHPGSLRDWVHAVRGWDRDEQRRA